MLHQSGADSVVTSSGTAGRMLGMATHAPGVAAVLEDLLSVGAGLDIVQSEVTAEQAGRIDRHAADGPVVAVLRGAELLHFDDERVAEVRAGDKLISVRSRG